MEYYSGLLALSQYAFDKDESVGLGADASKYLEDEAKYIRDTEKMKLGDIEVIDAIIIPSGEMKLCASHARAYCDMLEEHDFEQLEDLYLIAINNYSVLTRIFLLIRTNGFLKDEAIVKFLNDEFGSYFRGYLVRYGEEKALANIMEE